MRPETALGLLKGNAGEYLTNELYSMFVGLLDPILWYSNDGTSVTFGPTAIIVQHS